MRRLITLLSLTMICLISCNNNKKTEQGNDQQTEAIASVYTAETIMDVADTQVGKEVKIRGTVTHVCKHSGKKCFITDDEGKASIQIMAGGDITAFDKELVGSEIEATGILKENRMPKEDVDNREKLAHDNMHKEDASMEQCEAELNHVKEMREWMEKNNKDYFAIYYIEGTKYEVVD